MSMHYHIPVLLEQAIDYLVWDEKGLYIDATLGGGGHSAVLLDRLGDEASVIGVDQDVEALVVASRRFESDDRFEVLKGNFGYLETLLSPSRRGKVAGLLLDLGVSSHQIDTAERGFSFQSDGPLDMRMNAEQPLSAHTVVNTYDEQQLVDIFFNYGEERHSRRIASAIVGARPVESTGDLAKVISSVVRGPEQHIRKSVARIFQAIRIEVNREMEMLARVLESAERLIMDGGRLVVIAYHSLEDRLVKNLIKAGNIRGEEHKDFYGHSLSPWTSLTRKPVLASEAEVQQNPRARSAKLRAAERKDL